MERKKAGKHDQLGKYELIELLGQGGMGEVWKARDTQLQRFVAIKLLRAELQDDPDFSAYFMREARLVATLRHRNIVQIHDFQLTRTPGETIQAYMVMDYIEGGTLAGAIHATARKGLFWSANEIVDLFTAISLALDYAHRQGMIHRDIKPANILLEPTLASGHQLGEPILSDFGIARWQGGGLTVTGFLGTPLYISPEQAQSRPVDAHTDLYSLGIILYEVLTGVTPFHADNPLAIMLQHVEDQPPRPELTNPLVSPALAAVVLKSIAKDPRERFPSATAMTIALAQAFNLPVPALLNQPGEKREPSIPSNPLQPRTGMTPIRPAFAPPAQPLSFMPTIRNQPGPPSPFTSSPQEQNLMTPTRGKATRTTPAANFSAAPQQPATTTPHLPPQQPASALPPWGTTRPAQPPAGVSAPHVPERTGTGREPGFFARKWVLVICLICVVLLLLGTGAAVLGPRLFSSTATPTPAANGDVFGQIHFLSSSVTTQGSFDELQIDLHNVAPPPAGQIYYAWLTQTNNELRAPHWPLQVKNGTIQNLYTSEPPRTDLLSASNLFLISAEATTSTPVVPNLTLALHFYYALLTHPAPSSPAFEVKSCPTSNINSATNPCR
jgi:serine/threonine-protein kinase